MKNIETRPTEDELPKLRAQADRGNPVSMYEYGKYTLDRDPKTAVPYLEEALSYGVADAGMILASHYEKLKDIPNGLRCLLGAAEYDDDVMRQAYKAIYRFGRDDDAIRYLDMLDEWDSDSDADMAFRCLALCTVYDAVMKFPDRFPKLREGSGDLAKRAVESFENALDDGLWADDKSYGLLSGAAQYAPESDRAILKVRLEYLRENNGKEPKNPRLIGIIDESVKHMIEDSSFADRIEELAMNGEIPLDSTALKDCGELRMAWAKTKNRTIPVPTDPKYRDVKADWCTEEDAAASGSRWLEMGTNPVLARTLLHIAAAKGDTDAMFRLGYMVRMRLGEYGHYRAGVSDGMYEVYAPGSEKPGIVWIEESARAGCKNALHYLELQSASGDIESSGALKRLKRNG